MARADLLCELIKAGLRKDDMTFRRATQHFMLVFLPVEIVTLRMACAFGDPDLLLTGCGLINLFAHARGHEIILLPVDHQHRKPALGDTVIGRKVRKTIACQSLAEEVRQPDQRPA